MRKAFILPNYSVFLRPAQSRVRFAAPLRYAPLTSLDAFGCGVTRLDNNRHLLPVRMSKDRFLGKYAYLGQSLWMR